MRAKYPFQVGIVDIITYRITIYCSNVTFGAEAIEVEVTGQPSSRTSQFDFHFNASILQSLGFSSPSHSTPHRLRHRIDRASMYEPEEYSALVFICRSSTCQGMRFIILERHLVTRSEQSVGRNQTSSLVKSSASSSVLVRVYWLDDEGPPSYSSVMVRAYWLDDKGTLSCSSVLVRMYWLDDEGLTPASHRY